MQITMPEDGPDATIDDRRKLVRRMLDAAWVDYGYTAPNNTVYPWLWLWDSCFHALIWAELGEAERSLAELTAALSMQDRSGFVPHMGYQLDPARSVELWGRRGSSSITQPPMYGHALARLIKLGIDVPGSLIEQAQSGMHFLLRRRRCDDSGLLRVVHPWETGCDDSPRWDDFCPGTSFDIERWRRFKVDVLSTIERGPDGEPLDNPAFAAAPVSFSALTAWNTLELASATGDTSLVAEANALGEAVDARFDPERAIWMDGGSAGNGSGCVRTSDAALGLLVSKNDSHQAAVIAALFDPRAFGGAFGPRGVHAQEPTFDPDTYWRGPVWPQLGYLLCCALTGADAEELARRTVAGAWASGLAEYWNSDTGSAGGAVPQSWTGLALLLEPESTTSR